MPTEVFKVKSLGHTEYQLEGNKSVIIPNEVILAMAEQIRATLAEQIRRT